MGNVWFLRRLKAIASSFNTKNWKNVESETFSAGLQLGQNCKKSRFLCLLQNFRTIGTNGHLKRSRLGVPN